MPEASSRDQVAVQTIRAWAGETIFKRGQDYQLRGRVRELAATSSGGLPAWVQGSTRYATSVTLGKDDLTSRCTCPYGGACKHAVAVVLAYLDRPDQAPPLPVAAPNDPRLVLLEQQAVAAMLVTSPRPHRLCRPATRPCVRSSPVFPSSSSSSCCSTWLCASRSWATLLRCARCWQAMTATSLRLRCWRVSWKPVQRPAGAIAGMTRPTCQTTARSTMGSNCCSTRVTPMQSCGLAKSCSRWASARSSRPTTTARLRRRSPPALRSSFKPYRARRSRRTSSCAGP
jgi:hypothetical protein